MKASFLSTLLLFGAILATEAKKKKLAQIGASKDDQIQKQNGFSIRNETFQIGQESEFTIFGGEMIILHLNLTKQDVVGFK